MQYYYSIIGLQGLKLGQTTTLASMAGPALTTPSLSLTAGNKPTGTLLAGQTTATGGLTGLMKPAATTAQLGSLTTSTCTCTLYISMTTILYSTRTCAKCCTYTIFCLHWRT